MSKARYVIGDVHGCYKTLRKLLEDVIGIVEGDELYFLGDYADRGPSTKELIDYIIDLREQGYVLRTLMGNHEDMFLRTVMGDLDQASWEMNGGKVTIQSFGLSKADEIPANYVNFCKELEFYIELEDHWLVHAGFDYLADDFRLNTHPMLWSRDHTADMDKLNGKPLVHGHTPVIMEAIEQMVEDRMPEINLDNGCVYSGRIEGLGSLCCLELNSYKLFHQKNIDL